MDPGTDSGTDPGTDSGADPGTELGAGQCTDRGADPGTEVGAGQCTAHPPEPDAEAQSSVHETVSVVSWNANGLRARLASKQYGFLLAEDGTAKYDVVCVQETKADEAQIRTPADLSAAYPYRCYESTRLRKGQSGTALWSRRPFRARVPSPPTDMEGRVCAADFGTFVAVSVYVPNSGTKHTFRTGLWHATFSKYLDFLVGQGQAGRPVLVCMDANVCHEEIDIYAPGKHRNKVAGFYDIERQQFAHYLSRGFTDAFRAVHPDTRGAYTWFNPRVPQMRERNLGWRLDVVLVGGAARVAACTHLGDVRGSDHIPVVARVQVPAHVPSAAKQVPRICNAWLRPHSALLARLSATCPLTAAAYQVLQREWTTNMVDSDDESMSTECTSGPGNPNDTSLLAFASQSLERAEEEEPGAAQREQTRGFFRADGLDAQ
jgi:exodeoxyribonuclease-3